MKGIKVFAVVFVGLLLLVGTGIAQQPFADPCQTGRKFTVPFSVASAGTTQLIPPVTGDSISCCAYDINQSGGASSSFTVEHGPGAACSPAPAVMIGPFAAPTTVGVVQNIKSDNLGHTQFTTNSVPTGTTGPILNEGQGMCILVAGTAQVGGYFTCVQDTP
jgi:hypothetical protein